MLPQTTSLFQMNPPGFVFPPPSPSPSSLFPGTSDMSGYRNSPAASQGSFGYSPQSSMPASPIGFPSTSFAPSPALSAISLADSGRSLKRRRTRESFSQPTSVPIWDVSRQQRFESAVARLTASAGFPLWWVDNIEWHAFCAEFIPEARLFSRKVLTYRVLPAELQALQQSSRERIRGAGCTLTFDGWTGLNHRNLMAFQATTRHEVSL